MQPEPTPRRTLVVSAYPHRRYRSELYRRPSADDRRDDRDRRP